MQVGHIAGASNEEALQDTPVCRTLPGGGRGGVPCEEPLPPLASAQANNDLV